MYRTAGEIEDGDAGVAMEVETTQRVEGRLVRSLVLYSLHETSEHPAGGNSI